MIDNGDPEPFPLKIGNEARMSVLTLLFSHMLIHYWQISRNCNYNVMEFTVNPKEMKYLDIKVTKCIEDLYAENCKTLIKKQNQKAQRPKSTWRHPAFTGLNKVRCQFSGTGLEV